MNQGGRQGRLGDRIVRRPRQRELEPRHIKTHERHRFIVPPAASALLSLAGTFAALITIGTILLILPAASESGARTGFIDALFTSTSAVCVTGLVVANSGEYWSVFGQTVILGLMFLGGLGIMTAGLVVLVALGRRVTLNQRLLVRDAMGGASLGSVMNLGRYVLIFAIAVQALGFVALFFKLLFDFSVGEAAWQAAFHSVSAFNNAGFTIFPESDNLSRFRSDQVMLGIIGVMVVIGALGFIVIADIYRRRRPNRWSLDTRLVVIGTLSMWVIGALALIAFELRSGGTLDNMSLIDTIGNGTFQALTARTAGFTTIDYSETRAGTDFIFTFLMFVGGASGSVAGGIKVNTAMVLVFAGLASVGGRTRTELFKRELPVTQVARALAIVLLATLALFIIASALAFTETSRLDAGVFTFMDVLFEATSAFGTVGLSRGITPDLTDPGKVIVTLAMYLGRLGPLTLALGLALRERRAVYRFAQERVRIG
jgi:trk system potassium uptake protein TrkH